MISIKGKWFEFKRNIESNKLKMKQTATEWSLRYNVNNYQGQEFSLIIKYAKIKLTVPVTNAWPEMGASTIKIIKRRLRSTMKVDLLNALLLISLNGPTKNSMEATLIKQKATERYQSSKRRQVPGLTKVAKEKVKNVSVQTNLIKAVFDITKKLNHEIDNLNCYVQTNFDTTSDDEIDDDTYDDRFDEGDFDKEFKYFTHYYLLILFKNALIFL